LATGLVNGGAVAEVLECLAFSCTELFDAPSAGVMLADQRGHLHVMALAPGGRHTLDLFVPQRKQGPCLDCYRTSRPVYVVGRSDMEARWPAFARVANDRGFGSAYALPMRLGTVTIGALNFFRSLGSPMSEDNLEIAQALADVATVALLEHYSLRIISRDARVDTVGAVEMLRGYAERTRYRLADVAAHVTAGLSAPDELSASTTD
jgi:transcriptional regulator with GAF, ATPase, and Fis domain